VTLVGAKVQVRPEGVEADTDRLAVPVPVADTVIVEVPDAPAKIWDGVTVLAVMAVIVNPAMPVMGTVTVRVSVPLVPVIVTLKFWAGLHPPAVRVEVLGAGRVTVPGDMVAVQPVGVVEVMVRMIDPVNPLTAFADMVEVPVPGEV
jgi:hypothetical protein